MSLSKKVKMTRFKFEVDNLRDQSTRSLARF